MRSSGRGRRSAALQWRLDVKGAEIRAALAAAGFRAILLKGSAFTETLDPGGAARGSMDCDLLVSPSDLRSITTHLGSLGFRPTFLPADTPTTRELHAGTWLREADGLELDLHHNLPEVPAPSELTWKLVGAHTTWIEVGGADTEILDEVGTALLVALHGALHGPGFPRVFEDLRQATAVFGDQIWRKAHRLAMDLDAEEAFGQGLRLVPEGVELAERLRLANSTSTQRLLTWSAAPWGATVVDEFVSADSSRRRARLAWRTLFPTPRAMRAGTSLARHGALGLAAAYVIRPVRMAVRLVPALQAWRAARARARPGAG